MKITIELSTEDVIHLIGFISICETFGSPFVRKVAEAQKPLLNHLIKQTDYKEFDRAIDKCYRDIQAEKPKVDYSNLPLFQ